MMRDIIECLENVVDRRYALRYMWIYSNYYNKMLQGTTKFWNSAL